MLSHLLTLVETIVLCLALCASGIQFALLRHPRLRGTVLRNLQQFQGRFKQAKKKVKQQAHRLKVDVRPLQKAAYALSCRLAPLAGKDTTFMSQYQELQALVKAIRHLEDGVRVQQEDVQFYEAWLRDLEQRYAASVQQSQQSRQYICKALVKAQEDLSTFGKRFCAAATHKQFQRLDGAIWLLSYQNMEGRVPAEHCLRYAHDLQQQIALFCSQYEQGLI